MVRRLKDELQSVFSAIGFANQIGRWVERLALSETYRKTPVIVHAPRRSNLSCVRIFAALQSSSRRITWSIEDRTVSSATKEGPLNHPASDKPAANSPANTTDALPSLSAGQLWHNSTPAEIRSQWAKEGAGLSWDAWSRLLSKRLVREPFGDVSLKSVAWGFERDSYEAASLASLKQFEADKRDTSVEAAVEAWLDEVSALSGAASLDLAVKAVGWSYVAAAAARRLDHTPWWKLVDSLIALVHSSQQSAPGEDAEADIVLAHQLLAGEAAIVLATALPELRPARDLRKTAVVALTEGLLAMTDGEGMPPARCLPRLTALLGCWTRCGMLADANGKRCWDSQAQTQYEWLVRQALRLARPDGVLALTASPAIPPKLFIAALELGGDEADVAAASERLKSKAVQRYADDADDQPPTPSVNSEWSGLAVLAGGWKPNAPRLSVAYAGDQMQLEIAAGGAVLVSGAWPIDVSMEGVAVAAADDWEEQCWFSDDDGDYLELSIELTNGAKLDRQLFLAREDGVAYLSEILLSKADKAGAIEINTRLPLAPGAQFAPEKETRDGWLTTGGQQMAGLLPVGLPEWRVDPRGGELSQEEGQLRLTQTTIGRNLCAPLMLDFKPRRFAKQRTWRQLAVAEALERVAPDVAVGYRLQSGKDQWIVYRSLERPANRTLIGQNYSSEALVGRFLPTGDVEEYFEVETEHD